jgi:hypothetical protein
MANNTYSIKIEAGKVYIVEMILNGDGELIEGEKIELTDSVTIASKADGGDVDFETLEGVENKIARAYIEVQNDKDSGGAARYGPY